jgi:hypothetical protein
MTANVLKFVTEITVESVECCKCGHLIFMSEDFQQRRQRDHAFWYCTSCGQSQHWGGKSALEKENARLAAELEAERRRKTEALERANEAERRRAAQFGENTKLRNRIKHGVCPCCHRTVSQLARHMKAKHPQYTAEEIK